MPQTTINDGYIENFLATKTWVQTINKNKSWFIIKASAAYNHFV
jgi:hypothetical protein